MEMEVVMGLKEWFRAWAAPQVCRYDTSEKGVRALTDEQLLAISESPESYDEHSRKAVWSEMKRRIAIREGQEAEARELQRRKEAATATPKATRPVMPARPVSGGHVEADRPLLCPKCGDRKRDTTPRYAVFVCNRCGALVSIDNYIVR
jgi:DNA-directed RNA polymerase subunit RPC12/RpoP